MVLGHDAWIGHGAILLPGVRIGIGAAVGAGAVVTKDLPDFAVAVGNPARILRFRFAEPIRDALLRIAWWRSPRDKLAQALDEMRQSSAQEFCARHDPGLRHQG